MGGSFNGDIREPLRFSTGDPLSTQWMWLIDEIDYVSNRFPMFLDKNRDMFFAGKIISVFRIIDPANHPENLIRGGYKGLVESSRENDEKSGIVYAVGIALAYWEIYKKSPACAEKFYQQALDYPSAFGMVLSYVFVFVQEYCANSVGAASTDDATNRAKKMTSPPCERNSFRPLFFSSITFVGLLAFLGWHCEQKIKRQRFTCSPDLSWSAENALSNLSATIKAIRTNNISLALTNAPNQLGAITSGMATETTNKGQRPIILQGGFTATLPTGYKVSNREPNYLEITDEDGIPSIFISHDALDDTTAKLINAVEGSDLIINIFKKTQEKIENNKTKLMAKCGSDSQIVKWGTPYELKGVARSALRIDYVRQEKSSLLGNFEARVFCANIQISNDSRMYQVNIKHITKPETPLDARLPKKLLDFINSIAVTDS